MIRPASALLFMMFALTVAAATHGHWWRLPDRHNPFVPLVVSEQPNWLTRHKLDRLTREPGLCLAVLRSSGANAIAVPDRDSGADCGWADAVQLRSTAALSLATPVVMSCRAAVSLALWSRHEVQPAAARHLGRYVSRLDHLGTYACRNVNNAEHGRRSRHARAEALDIAAFVLEDGSRVSVLRDWPRDDPRGRFLHEAHAGACRWFDGVLGPAYNRQHADHLHFERSLWRVCK